MLGDTNTLTLLTVSLFLFQLRRPIWYTLLPMLLMLTMTVWAMCASLATNLEQLQQKRGVGEEIWTESLLISVSVVVLLMTLWLLVEAALSFARGRDGLEMEDTRATVKHPQAEATDTAHLG